MSQKHPKMALFGLFLDVSHAGSTESVKNAPHGHSAATVADSMTKSRISVTMASYKSLSMSYCCLRYGVPGWHLGARDALQERRRPQIKLTSPNMTELCAKCSATYTLTSARTIRAVSALILLITSGKSQAEGQHNPSMFLRHVKKRPGIHRKAVFKDFKHARPGLG